MKKLKSLVRFVTRIVNIKKPGLAVDGEVRSILTRELHDGYNKRTDSYWTSKGHNVGKDVSEAARIAVATVQNLLANDARVALTVAIKALRQASNDYSRAALDPDGFGAGTFTDILADLSALAAKFPGAQITAAAIPV